jgi:hypothetical protein
MFLREAYFKYVTVIGNKIFYIYSIYFFEIGIEILCAEVGRNFKIPIFLYLKRR